MGKKENALPVDPQFRLQTLNSIFRVHQYAL